MGRGGGGGEDGTTNQENKKGGDGRRKLSRINVLCYGEAPPHKKERKAWK